MRRGLRILFLLLLTAPGCSAVGAWVYEDPSYMLRAVTVRPGLDIAANTDSLELIFIGCNLNDFDLTETSFATRLQIAGKEAGQGEHVTRLYLATRDTARFTVTIPLAAGVLPDQGGRSFQITGLSKLQTPIGDRAVNVRLDGRVERAGEALHWSSRTPGCRPGSSVLPASFDTRPVIREDPPARQQGGGLNPEAPR